eukprot:gene11792-11937_t
MALVQEELRRVASGLGLTPPLQPPEVKHPGQANQVFSALPGRMFTDSVGRHSKRLHLQATGSQVVVRKMACHNGLAYGKDQRKDRGMKSAAGKKRKAATSSKAGGKRRNSKK